MRRNSELQIEPESTGVPESSNDLARATGHAPFLVVVLLLTGFGPACDHFPQDPLKTTDNIVRRGSLTVGISHDGEELASVARQEKALVEEIARDLGVEIQWRKGNAHPLLEDVEEFRLPIAAVTLPADSPFAKRVGISRPYLTDGPGGKSYVLAVPPGENRWLMRIDRIIARQGSGKRQ